MDPLTRLLMDMTYLLLVAGGCSILFSRLKMPPIIGYIAAGILLGPTMLHDVAVDPNTITMLSSLGIVLLMFSIGLELNLQRLRQLGSFTFIVLALEMPLMVVIGYLTGLAIGLGSIQAIFLGAVLSGTSTAVIVGVLRSRKDISREDTEMVIGITVMEDLGQVIILSMAAPLLVGDAPALGSVVLMVGGIALFVGVTVALGVRVVPRALNWIRSRYSSEVLFIVSIGLCFAMALVSNLVGLSIAIGAFLMGLVVSQADCAKEVLAKVGPMKEVFMAVFFISIGTKVVPMEVLGNIALVLTIAAVFIVVKFIGVAGASYLVSGRARSAFTIGLSMVAMGEFAFIIATMALEAGVVSQQFFASVIGAALVTMLVLPLVSGSSTRLFNIASATAPQALRGALARFDAVRNEVAQRASATPEARKTIHRELVLIYVDILAIVLIQVVVVVFQVFNGLVWPMAEGIGTSPEVLLFLLILVLMVPALANLTQGVKRIAMVLAGNNAPATRHWSNGIRLYRRFRNLGELAAMLIIVLLFLPFIAQYAGYHPSVWLVTTSLTVAIVYTSWRIYLHARQHIRFKSDPGQIY